MVFLSRLGEMDGFDGGSGLRRRRLPDAAVAEGKQLGAVPRSCQRVRCTGDAPSKDHKFRGIDVEDAHFRTTRLP